MYVYEKGNYLFKKRLSIFIIQKKTGIYAQKKPLNIQPYYALKI